MKGKLHLILQIEVSTWHKREQLWQIGGQLIPQISLDQVMNGLLMARTIYLGSAPNAHNPNRGLAESQVRLGCMQPGETVAIFGIMCGITGGVNAATGRETVYTYRQW